MGVRLYAVVGVGVITSALSTGCHREPQNQSGGKQVAQQGSGPSAGQLAVDARPEKVASDDEVGLVGDWKGQSLVQAKNTPAKDEIVIWLINKANSPGKLIVRADKIVNEKAISMGALEFTYDKAQNVIVCQYEQGVWSLQIKGKKMEGTLTRPDQTVLRRVLLEKIE